MSTTSSTTPTKKRRRAYIGNLRPRPNLDHSLYNNLFIPYSLSVRNFPITNNNDDVDNDGHNAGIVVIQPKQRKNNSGSSGSSSSSSVFALVEFHDVEYAIQVLDGVMFDGRTLRVSKEKTNNFGGGSSKGGFGSNRWAGDDGFGSGGIRGNRGRGRGNSGGRNNSRPSSRRQSNKDNSNDKLMNNIINREGIKRSNWNDNVDNNDDSSRLLSTHEETVNEKVAKEISSYIKEGDDEVTSAIAATAAMTLLSSVDAFGLDNNENDEDAKHQEVVENIVPNNTKGVEGVVMMTNQDFQSRCKLPLSDLMAEYGEQDVHWKEQKPQSQNNKEDISIPTKNNVGDHNNKVLTNDDFQSRCKMSLSDLMDEYGEQDVDWKKTTNNQKQEQQVKISTTTKMEHYGSKDKQRREYNNNNNNNINDNNGMLAPHGKASIHLELVSFGYKYGAPSQSKKRGFSYAHPLPPLDVRDLDRAPGHVAKFNGLSHLVKRSLLNPSHKKTNDDDADEKDEGENDTSNNESNKEQSPMRKRANDIADEIIKSLVEAIDEGGHGPISPLSMSISIGSEYGRHRSVVLVEHLAVVLRARLRRNDGRGFNDDTTNNSNGIVKQKISVGTRHRDVEARHVDEEAFGEDLKREARKAEKIKRRQEIEDSGWDAGSW